MRRLHPGPASLRHGTQERAPPSRHAIVSARAAALAPAAPAPRATSARPAKAHPSVRAARYFLRNLTLHACTRPNADRSYCAVRTRPPRSLRACAALGARAELTIAAPDRGASSTSIGAFENETTEHDPTALIRRARGTSRRARRDAGRMRRDDAFWDDDPRRAGSGTGAVVTARIHAVRQLKSRARAVRGSRAPEPECSVLPVYSGPLPARQTLQNRNHTAILQ